MVLKLGQVLRFRTKHNVCNSDSRAPTFAPMESIRQRRERVGLTQKELAEACGCHFSHICHIEHGRTKPSLEVFVKMTEELKVSPKKLLELLNVHPGASVTDIQKERARRSRR